MTNRANNDRQLLEEYMRDGSPETTPDREDFHEGANDHENTRVRARRWHITWNNYVEQVAKERLMELTKNPLGGLKFHVTYLAACHEVGEIKHTPHLQIYMQTSERVYRTDISRMFPNCKVSAERTTPQNSINYITKTVRDNKGTMIRRPFFLFGIPNLQSGPRSQYSNAVPFPPDYGTDKDYGIFSSTNVFALLPEQARCATSLTVDTAASAGPVLNFPPLEARIRVAGGKRSRDAAEAEAERERKQSQKDEELMTYMQFAKEGKWGQIPPSILATKGPFLKKYVAGAYKELPNYVEPRLFHNLWIYGGVNCGKTFTTIRAFQQFGIYQKDPTNKWFDGMTHDHNCILYDELNIKPAREHKALLKSISDKYPVTFEVKGDSLRHRPQYVVVTSNWSIDEIFADNEIDRDALHKRFFQIKWENYRGCYTPEMLVHAANTRTLGCPVPRKQARKAVRALEREMNPDAVSPSPEHPSTSDDDDNPYRKEQRSTCHSEMFDVDGNNTFKSVTVKIEEPEAAADDYDYSHVTVKSEKIMNIKEYRDKNIQKYFEKQSQRSQSVISIASTDDEDDNSTICASLKFDTIRAKEEPVSLPRVVIEPPIKKESLPRNSVKVKHEPSVGKPAKKPTNLLSPTWHIVTNMFGCVEEEQKKRTELETNWLSDVFTMTTLAHEARIAVHLKTNVSGRCNIPNRKKALLGCIGIDPQTGKLVDIKRVLRKPEDYAREDFHTGMLKYFPYSQLVTAIEYSDTYEAAAMKRHMQLPLITESQPRREVGYCPFSSDSG